jgi:hypothetical protein
MGEYDPYEFDMYLKEGILGTYPREQKTVLDTVLADWAARDPFKKHTEVIIQTVLSLLDKAKYNKRTAPYYAFVQLFNIPDEQQRFQELQHQQKQEEKAIAYSVKSGARIDLAHYSNGSDKVLVEGCRKILKIVTQSGKADAWVSDCLYVARPDIIQWYIEWLSTGLQKELKSKGKDTVPYSKYMSMTLQNAHIGSLSSYAVPVLLLSADLDVLRWLCFRNPKASNILVRYFSAGPQVTIHMLVQNLLTTKPKDYIDILLLFLRENVCDSWNKTAGSSHSWFKNHFLGTLLSITGGDASEKGVSSLLFQHMFTSANDFEWLFAMPTEKQEDFYASFPSLDIAKSHTIYNIKNNGLSAMLQEMVRLDDSGQRERLVNIWYKLWITSDQDHLSFAVPVNWIMQCIGLYDQAPALVKQMIEKLLVIGIQSKQDFTIHVLNLLLISDMPEPDSLFDIFLKVCNQQFDINNDAMINTIQRSITDILIELAEEIQVEFEFNLSKEALYEKTKIEAARIAAKNSKKKGKRIMKKGKSYVQTRRLWQQQQQQQQHQELEESLSNQLEDGSLTMKALITLVQRVINFLLAFLSSTSEPARIWHQKIQDGLIKTPLLYDALSKLAKSLSSQTEELQEDIQAVIDTCLEYLRKKKETSLVDIIQKILS